MAGPELDGSGLRPADDGIHATGDEPDWREAFYFDFIDPVNGISGFGYSGVHPNREIGDVTFAVWKKGVLLARFTRWDFNIPRDIGEERLDFGPLCFRSRTPFEQWQMCFDDGFCRLELNFDAIHPPYSWSDSERTLADSNSHHYEQQGRYAGMLRVGADVREISGVGVRDHAWGWGARAGIRRWLWASAQFSPEFAFNGFQISLADGRDIQYGYVWRGRENAYLRRSRMAVDYAPIGQAPAAFRVELEDRQGRGLEASAKVLNAFNISHQERNKKGYHYFCAAEYTSGGNRGFGYLNAHWRSLDCRPQDWQVTRA